MTKEKMTRTKGAIQAILNLPGVADIAKRFSETTLEVKLEMPSEAVLAKLVDPHKVVEEAQAFTVDSDESYKLAKAASDSLKNEADSIEGDRTAGTKPLLAIKAGWDALMSPAVKAREFAAKVYQQKMRAYEARCKAEDEANRRAQAEEAERQRAELRRQAAEKEKAAAKLKSRGKKEEALREAESLKQAAEHIPEQFAATTSSVPSLGSGGKQGRWVGEVTDKTEFLNWLWPEELWHDIASFNQGELNKLAKAVKDGKDIPGFKASQESSYRRESKKKEDPR